MTLLNTSGFAKLTVTCHDLNFDFLWAVGGSLDVWADTKSPGLPPVVAV